MNIENKKVDILLVEDNPSDAKLTLRALKKNNLENTVEWVKDGEQALDFIYGRGEYEFRENMAQPKVILLDLRLPKLDGIDVLKSLRSNEETKTLPVVVLTSSKEDKDMVAAYDLGVNSYVPKPVDFNEFSKTVAELGLYWVLINQPLSN